MIAARWRLLRLLPRGGAGVATLLVLLQATRAVMPAAQALAVGRLVAEPAVLTAGLVAGLFLADQLGWLLLAPARQLLVKRIDGDLRSRVRGLATGLPGLEALESDDFQDRLSRAVDAGMSIARERSAGNAAAGQLELTFRMVSALAAAAVLARYSVPLAAGVLALALVNRVLVRRQWIRLVDGLDADTAGQRFQFYLSEQAVHGAAKDVRLFGLSDWFAGRFRAVTYRTYGPVWRDLLGVLPRQWAPAVLSLAGAALVLAVPALTQPPAALATCVFAGFGVLAISAMGMEAYDIEYGLRGLAAFDELSTSSPAAVAAAAPGPAPEVRCENVRFGYPGGRRPVLDDLTVTIPSGQTVAIVGDNGAGKTTLVKVLAGLYRADAGRVTVAGRDPRAGRPAMTVLFQDFVRYPATLRDNVTAGLPGDDDAVRDALRRAGATGLPADLDTLLWREGTGGTDLSGGQWQRVALARVLFAVAAGRRLLVLDEPTAHLDVRAEAEFHEEVVARVHDTTTLLISHRLSTVRAADRILVLHEGRIAEDGTHDELLALGGRYAAFFRTQAEAFRP